MIQERAAVLDILHFRGTASRGIDYRHHHNALEELVGSALLEQLVKLGFWKELGVDAKRLEARDKSLVVELHQRVELRLKHVPLRARDDEED